MRQPAKHSFLAVFGISLLLVFAPALAACSGENDDASPTTPAEVEPAPETDGGDETTAAETGADDADADAEAVAAEAERLRDVLENELRELGDVSSLDDLESRLADVRGELDESRRRLDGIDASGEAEQRREELRNAADRVERELAEVQSDVEDRDLRGALDAVRSLSLDELERAIDRAEDLDGA